MVEQQKEENESRINALGETMEVLQSVLSIDSTGMMLETLICAVKALCCKITSCDWLGRTSSKFDWLRHCSHTQHAA